MIEREELAPVELQELVPLCMDGFRSVNAGARRELLKWAQRSILSDLNVGARGEHLNNGAQKESTGLYSRCMTLM